MQFGAAGHLDTCLLVVSGVGWIKECGGELNLGAGKLTFLGPIWEQQPYLCQHVVMEKRDQEFFSEVVLTIT